MTKACVVCGRKSQSKLCEKCYKSYRASGESLETWLLRHMGKGDTE